MKTVTLDQGIKALNDIYKNPHFGDIRITLAQDAFAFNEMEGYQYLFNVTVKGSELPDGRRVKGKRFRILTNGTYMPDDEESENMTGQDWADELQAQYI
jgi:hypothetical protein